MICKICGTSNPEGSVTCLFCGAKMEPEESGQETVQKADVPQDKTIRVVSSAGALRRFGMTQEEADTEERLLRQESEVLLEESYTPPQPEPDEFLADTEAEMNRRAVAEQAADIVNRAVEKIIARTEREESGEAPEAPEKTSEKDTFSSAMAESSAMTEARRLAMLMAEKVQAESDERRKKLEESTASPLHFELAEEDEPEEAENAEESHNFVLAAGLADTPAEMAAKAEFRVSEALRQALDEMSQELTPAEGKPEEEPQEVLPEEVPEEKPEPEEKDIPAVPVISALAAEELSQALENLDKAVEETQPEPENELPDENQVSLSLIDAVLAPEPEPEPQPEPEPVNGPEEEILPAIVLTEPEAEDLPEISLSKEEEILEELPEEAPEEENYPEEKAETSAETEKDAAPALSAEEEPEPAGTEKKAETAQLEKPKPVKAKEEEEPKKKRWWILLVLLLAVLAVWLITRLFGCGKDPTPATTPAETSSIPEATTKDALPVLDPTSSAAETQQTPEATTPEATMPEETTPEETTPEETTPEETTPEETTPEETTPEETPPEETTPEETTPEETEAEDPFAYLGEAAVGDVIRFGAYEQDGNLANGKEEVEWLVLAKEDERILVISRQVLTAGAFSSGSGTDWENSTIRKKLNGDFLNTAFGEAEQGRVLETAVENPGGTTSDKVFLLSVEEVESLMTPDTIRTTATKQALNEQVYTREGQPFWWLRSPGKSAQYAAHINLNGVIDKSGEKVSYPNGAIRPAVWLSTAPAK